MFLRGGSQIIRPDINLLEKPQTISLLKFNDPLGYNASLVDSANPDRVWGASANAVYGATAQGGSSSIISVSGRKCFNFAGKSLVAYDKNIIVSGNYPNRNYVGFNFGEGNFTFQGFIVFVNVTFTCYNFGNNRLLGNIKPTLGMISNGTNRNVGIEFFNGTTTIVSNSINNIYNTGIFYHFALVRVGEMIRFYLAGNLVATQTVGNTLFDFSDPYFVWGTSRNTAISGLNGRLDDLKISNYAVYLENFTPPSSLDL